MAVSWNLARKHMSMCCARTEPDEVLSRAEVMADCIQFGKRTTSADALEY